jgi:hypothetical protein
MQFDFGIVGRRDPETRCSEAIAIDYMPLQTHFDQVGMD